MSNILKWLQTVMILAGLIKPLIQLIEAVEQPGHGAEKKAAVLDLMKEAIVAAEKAVPGLDLDQDMIVAFLSKAIDMVVNFKNLIGGFRKTPAADTAG